MAPDNDTLPDSGGLQDKRPCFRMGKSRGVVCSKIPYGFSSRVSQAGFPHRSCSDRRASPEASNLRRYFPTPTDTARGHDDIRIAPTLSRRKCGAADSASLNVFLFSTLRKTPTASDTDKDTLTSEKREKEEGRHPSEPSLFIFDKCQNYRCSRTQRTALPQARWVICDALIAIDSILKLSA